MNIFSIAGSKSHAVAEVLSATNTEKMQLIKFYQEICLYNL